VGCSSANKSWCARFGPPVLGCTTSSPLGKGEGHLQTTTAGRPDIAGTATSSRLGARLDGRSNSAGVHFWRHQQQDSTRVGKKVRFHSSWVDGGVVAGLVQRSRDGEEGVRGVEVPARSYSPTTASRCGSLQRLPAHRRRSAAQPRFLLPTRAPPHSSPLPFLRWQTRKGQNPNATRPVGEAWPPGCRRGQKRARARSAARPGWLARRVPRRGRAGVVGAITLGVAVRVEGSFPPGETQRRARAPPGSVCVPASGLPVPSRAHIDAVR
jgi:hypothetical protein